MNTLLTISPTGEMFTNFFERGMFTIGNTFNADLQIADLAGELIFIQKSSGVLVEKKGSANSNGPFNKSINTSAMFEYNSYHFFFLPFQLINEDKLSDWNASLLPTKLEDDQYLLKMLKFLLHTMNATQGAILLLKDNHLQTLAANNVELRDQSEFFLQRIIDDQKDESIISMNYNTYTMLFNVGLLPLDFYLIKQPISNNEYLILYIPKTKIMKAIPVGMLKTLLSLSVGNISNYILHQRYKSLRAQNNHRVEHGFFWGSSEIMRSVKTLSDKLAKTSLNLLIEGETGVGKEMLVKYLKERSGINKIVAVNCAAIPKELAESVLFGHVKGAFTGALSNQLGKIAEADGGILFLDEIGELDLVLQAKLLRVLNDSVVTPIGGKDLRVKFWPIAATHRSIPEMIANQTFREDLYFRINEASIRLPSLKERQSDIVPLATYFLDQLIKNNDLPEKKFDQELLNYLQNREWRGNIRELHAFIRKIVLLSETDLITLKEIMPSTPTLASRSQYPDDLSVAKNQFVSQHIAKMLANCQGDKQKAADKLGITLRNLYRLI